MAVELSLNQIYGAHIEAYIETVAYKQRFNPLTGQIIEDPQTMHEVRVVSGASSFVGQVDADHWDGDPRDLVGGVAMYYAYRPMDQPYVFKVVPRKGLEHRWIETTPKQLEEVRRRFAS